MKIYYSKIVKINHIEFYLIFFIKILSILTFLRIVLRDYLFKEKK